MVGLSGQPRQSRPKRKKSWFHNVLQQSGRPRAYLYGKSIADGFPGARVIAGTPCLEGYKGAEVPIIEAGATSGVDRLTWHPGRESFAETLPFPAGPRGRSFSQAYLELGRPMALLAHTSTFVFFLPAFRSLDVSFTHTSGEPRPSLIICAAKPAWKIGRRVHSEPHLAPRFLHMWGLHVETSRGGPAGTRSRARFIRPAIRDREPHTYAEHNGKPRFNVLGHTM